MLLPFLSLELRVLLAVLAVYRLARLVSVDDGPLAAIKWLRRRMGQIAAAQTLGTAQAAMFLSLVELINCPYCLGVWFAALLFPMLWVPTLCGDFALVALGLAGGQDWLQSKVGTR